MITSLQRLLLGLTMSLIPSLSLAVADNNQIRDELIPFLSWNEHHDIVAPQRHDIIRPIYHIFIADPPKNLLALCDNQKKIDTIVERLFDNGRADVLFMNKENYHGDPIEAFTRRAEEGHIFYRPKNPNKGKVSHLIFLSHKPDDGKSIGKIRSTLNTMDEFNVITMIGLCPKHSKHEKYYEKYFDGAVRLLSYEDFISSQGNHPIIMENPESTKF